MAQTNSLNPQNERIKSEKLARQRELETRYLKAMEFVKGGGYALAKAAALDRVLSILPLDNVTEGQAQRLVGRIQQIVIDLEETQFLINEYEQNKKILEQIAALEQGLNT